MADVDPFEALELSPTLDMTTVKRSYFALLQRHPPHADPEGFRRLRGAYEALTAPGALELAYATVRIRAEEELTRWRERWEAPMQQAVLRCSEAAARAAAVEAFVKEASSMTLRELAALYREPGRAG